MFYIIIFTVDRNKMAAIMHITFSNQFSEQKCLYIDSKSPEVCS